MRVSFKSGPYDTCLSASLQHAKSLLQLSRSKPEQQVWWYLFSEWALLSRSLISFLISLFQALFQLLRNWNTNKARSSPSGSTQSTRKTPGGQITDRKWKWVTLLESNAGVDAWNQDCHWSLCGGHSIWVCTLSSNVPDYTAMRDIACRPDSGKVAERVRCTGANCERPGWGVTQDNSLCLKVPGTEWGWSSLMGQTNMNLEGMRSRERQPACGWLGMVLTEGRTSH